MGGNAFQWNKKLISSLIGWDKNEQEVVGKDETYYVGGLFLKLPQERRKAACALLSAVAYLSTLFYNMKNQTFCLCLSQELESLADTYNENEFGVLSCWKLLN